MKFKPTAIGISKDDPFKEDLLSRKESAEVLTEFVGNLNETFVLGIDSPWGTGKTIFLKMWLQHLQNQGYPCIYFNAWENDFSDSPLVSLIGELEIAIDALVLGEKQEAIAFKIYEKTKKTGAALLKSALPTAIKLATAGVFDLAAIKQVELVDLAEDIAKQQIDEYKTDKKTIVNFRKDLADLIKTISEKTKPEDRNPLIFIIDELDRCRPTYAVELLEKVKHLFSVEGLVFILAIDRQQLAESVRSLYGSGMDAEGYLRRFIDLEYRFPIPNIEDFINGQFARFGLNEILAAKVGQTHSDGQILRQVVPKLFSLFGLSLRTQEQCFTQLAVVLRTTQPNAFFYAHLVTFLICLRVVNRKLYSAYVKGDATPVEVIDYIQTIPGGRQLVDSEDGYILEAYLVNGIRDWKKRSEAIEAISNLANPPSPRKPEDPVVDKVKSDRAKQVNRHLGWVGQYSQDMIGYLSKKIELAQRFTTTTS